MSHLRHLIRGISQLDGKSKNSEPDSGKYEKYIARLKAPTSISESCTTATKLISWISFFQLGNPAEPWTAGKYLVRNDMPVSARLAGLELLKSCIQSRAELPAVLRLMFFNDILKEFSREDLDLQFTALVILTDDARDVSGFSHRICSSLCSWTDQVLTSLETRKQLNRRGQPLSITERHRDLQQIISYMTKLIKFNFAILEAEDVALLADRIVSVCKKTGGQGDIQESLNFFDAVTRYGYLPLQSLAEVINVICSVFCGLSTLQDSALTVMQNFLRSHMSQATLQTLKEIIKGRDDVHDDVVLGALGFLTTRWTISTDELSTYSYSLQSLFQSYRIGLRAHKRREDRNKRNLDRGYLDSVYKILQVRAIVVALSSDEWELPLEIITICSRSLDGPLRAASGTCESDSLETIFRDVLNLLEQYYSSPDMSLSVPSLLRLWLTCSVHIPVSTSQLLFEIFKEDLMCYPSNSTWIENTEELFRLFFLDVSQESHIRSKILQHIEEILSFVASTAVEETFTTMLLKLLESVKLESDSLICNSLVSLLVRIIVRSNEQFSTQAAKILRKFCTSVFISTKPTSAGSESVVESSASSRRQSCVMSSSISTYKEESVLSTNSSEACTVISQQSNILATLAIDGLLCIFMWQFGHTRPTAIYHAFQILTDILKVEQLSGKLRIVQVFGCLRVNRYGHLLFDRSAMTLNLDPHGLMPQEVASLSADTASQFVIKSDDFDDTMIHVSRYFEVLCELTFNTTDWQFFSTSIAVIKEQLGNRPLFEKCTSSLMALRTSLCHRLTGSQNYNLKNVPAHVKREDIMTTHVDLLALLVGYHDIFSKAQEDEIVTALQHVLSHHQRATPACIRTLTICAYEIPLSTSKNLSSILLRISQLTTVTHASVHILEFLSALAKLEDQYVNFREDDYRRVFAVALQQIQYSNAAGRDASSTGAPDPLAQPIQAYVLMLATDTVYAWFLALKLSYRPRYLRWIVDGLLSASSKAKQLDERGQVCFEFLARFCYSNAEIKGNVQSTNKFEDEHSSTKTWLFGNSVMTLQTMHLSGLTEVTIRRPSGTTLFLCKPNSDFEALTVVSAEEARGMILEDEIVGSTERKIRGTLSSLDETSFTPSHMLLQLTAPPELNDNEKPVLLFEDDVTRRAIGTLDRIPVVDFHKIGIIYVGIGQTSEREILANTYGSPEYVSFLEQLGELVRLKDNHVIYTGGLDTNSDEDGEFAYVHKEKISQIIFHTCTMMPTRLDIDPNCTRKKSHIGNDFVNIIWNSSNKDYDPSTIASEFNFINIVVKPASSERQQSNSRGVAAEQMYRVKVLPHEALPSISPVIDWRLISASKISIFVRTVAVHCNIYAQIHHSPRGSFSSMWTQRLVKIHTLRQRTQQKYLEMKDDIDPSKTNSAYNFAAYL